MILWINGAFGSGKTQAAHELHRRLPNSYVYDPENAGYFIRSNLPPDAKRDDFQHYPMWREFNYAMFKHMDQESNRIIIAPMTVTNPEYFDEIVGRLRRDGVDVRHFTLCASREVLLKRLRSRYEGANSWAAQQIDRCISGLSQEVFRQHIDTDRLSIDEVVSVIAEHAGIQLLPDRRSRTRKQLDLLKTKLSHVRFLG
ncbi:AAA family ATPase [Paenibacillus lactis]|uniref:AAA family ATPase n=1 Tax=Paenibacillus lactis TaxID=228574 RepID=UPI001B2D51B0|nr:AAA family ATPase [Paenibacillus lactis]GIO92218.1 tunicamycin resistance protein [Paenibacillus lactis]